MISALIRFLNIIMAALITGTLFGIWVGYNPKNLSGPVYAEQQQSAITALNTLMPLLGLITILLTLISAYLLRHEKNFLITLIIASVLLIVSALVTRLGNQPINKVVMTWNKNDLPDDWTKFREKWWTWHIVRTLTTFLAFCLIVWSNLKKPYQSNSII